MKQAAAIATAAEIKRVLAKKANPKKAKILRRFFKTGKGEYGEGDQFLGITMPELRKVATQFQFLSFRDVTILLHSSLHEHRMAALLIWCNQFVTGNSHAKKRIFSGYIKNRSRINNWDLIDVTCPHIVGAHLYAQKDRRHILHTLAASTSLWDRRIAILATFYFIRRNDFKDAIFLAEKLVHDPHDLMHKAVGWMLREVGKRNLLLLRSFLKHFAVTMPRTMLRYAIEKLSKNEQRHWMKRKSLDLKRKRL